MAFNLLDILYRKVWVKLFGRILFYFSSIIEGKKITKPPTYYIDKEER